MKREKKEKFAYGCAYGQRYGQRVFISAVIHIRNL
jgi:hypothetical protein